ncbi:peptidylprolyl isomerase [Engelhardtia mirabilis]|uniref:peptidylprolyl isomerase n=1 Tax=Engelhardtia mirabilis TaxID=2528011 RepID=A0A518BHV0_9BACT|nr:Peptidyl-prolyl cis-trans isomerase A precursor [Planctomycetes bacterium Pla133]QDV00877.1 Peptidyl-prolyl cis-trans isomerase A precursor [Planctomycetes bacterium Pla86]
MIATATIAALASALGAPAFAAPALGVEPTAVAQEQAPVVTFEAPTMYVAGMPYVVDVRIQAPAEGASAAGWWLSPAGFLINGEPAQRRESEALIKLPPNALMSLSFDLGPFITATGNFELSFARAAYEGGPVAVDYFVAVPTEGEAKVDFMTMPLEQLDDYQVVLETNRGTMVADFWPEVAPNHVRNFLDLSYTGFYDGTLFHRVIPGFMIQGGDPYTKDPSKSRLWGTGNGPRQLQAEFNDRQHVPGVLSAARSQDPNSASSQFFLMHARSTHLDGQYSAFGQLTRGLEVVDKIVKSPRNGQDRPDQPQQLIHAIVVKKS